MQVCKFTDPPAIVAEAELEEHELVEGIVQATLRDNFAVGRYALQWHQHHSRKRSDATLARMVMEANPDCVVGEEYIRACRTVAQEFRIRVGTLPWTHHRVAAEQDRPNAAKWAAKAEKGGWSVLKLQNEIEKKLTCGGKLRLPRTHKYIQRDIRAFLKEADNFADRSYVRSFISQHGDILFDKRVLLRKKFKRIRANIDFMEKRMALLCGTDRKEA